MGDNWVHKPEGGKLKKDFGLTGGKVGLQRSKKKKKKKSRLSGGGEPSKGDTSQSIT